MPIRERTMIAGTKGAVEVVVRELERFDHCTVRTAHDVRKLVVCRCGGLASKGMAIDHEGEWFHGRCFLALFGFKALRALPLEKRGRLTLNDIAPVLTDAQMRKLLK